jgi:hypothetical protein
MEQEAGDVISVFIEKFIKPAIQGIESIDVQSPSPVTLSYSDDEVGITSGPLEYKIKRT